MNFIIGKYQISLYAIFILLSITIGYIFIYVNLRKKGAEKSDILYSMIYILVFMLLGAKLFYGYTENTTFIEAGFSSYGSAIGTIIGVLLYTKLINKNLKEKNEFIQYYIISLPLFYSIAKIGCFFAGCCYGIPYNGIGNVSYIHLNLYQRLPIQLIESIVFFNIFLFCLLMLKNINSKYLNMLTIVMSAIAKGLLDFGRDSHYLTTELSVNQITSIILIMSVIIYYVVINRNRLKIFK